MGRVFLLLAAGGSSTRFGGAKKEYLVLGGKSVLRRSLEAFLGLPRLSGVVVVCPPGREDETAAALGGPFLEETSAGLDCGLRILPGGETRQASVAAGLAALAAMAGPGEPGKGELVLVHDAARPWITPRLAEKVVEAARIHGAALALCDFADTPKRIGNDGFVSEHPERSATKGAQTPQGFALRPLLAAHELAAAEGWACTDDSALWARYLGPVAWVEGERENRKLTFREDLGSAAAPQPELRIGEGWDIHPLVEGRDLVLGGQRIDHPKGEAGYSDGDVLWHAVIDALLGAAGLGDIGSHFPPGDPRWKDADSSRLASLTLELLRDSGWRPLNLDCTVLLEAPRLGPWREAIRGRMAQALDMDLKSVSVKAKTFEGFGEVGRGEAVQARAVVLLCRAGPGD